MLTATAGGLCLALSFSSQALGKILTKGPRGSTWVGAPFHWPSSSATGILHNERILASFLCHLHAVISLLMSPALTTAKAAKNAFLFASQFILLAFPDLVFLLAWPGISLMVAKAAPDSFNWECPALYHSTSNPTLLRGHIASLLKTSSDRCWEVGGAPF